MTFRRTALALAAQHGIDHVPELEAWVEEEKRVVTEHLRHTLTPDPAVIGPLTALAGRLRLAAVSSSALVRLHACLAATELSELIPAELVFSAEDSLPTPTSKPDPAIYLHACERLGIEPAAGLAVEDSLPGARSAVAAGCPTVGNVVFVPAAERAERIAGLYDVGVLTVVSSWDELAELLLPTLDQQAPTAEVVR
jgi:beta-phosphoglucomutase-like phosphatase (HAD superfamily)